MYDRIVSEAGLEPIHWADDPAPNGLGKRVRNDRIKNLLDLKLAYPAH